MTSVVLEAGIVLALVLGYAAVLAFLIRRRLVGPDRTLSLFGPALMIKTRRGQTFLERVGRFRRFWSVVGDVAIVLAGIAMATIVAILALEALLVSRIPASEAPSPQTALGLPGINPIIPLGYGLVALIVAVVLHELFHGVIARSQKIGVKSIGVLWLVIPIGAFVEQDEAMMNAAPRRSRDRVVAAGILANFVLAILFFAGAAAVVDSSIAPNATGVGVEQVVAGDPAQNASIQAGDILEAVNGTATPDDTALFDALSQTHPNQSIIVEYYSTGAGHSVSTRVTLGTAPASNGSAKPRGFLGVVVSPFPPSEISGLIASPWAQSVGPLAGILAWIALPIWGFEPISGTTASFFHATGPFAGLGLGNLWTGVNLLYWLAWMNLLLGLSNALPIFPFDGGLLFRDFFTSAGSRLRRGWDAARLEVAATRATVAVSLLLVVMLLWILFGPSL